MFKMLSAVENNYVILILEMFKMLSAVNSNYVVLEMFKVLPAVYSDDGMLVNVKKSCSYRNSPFDIYTWHDVQHNRPLCL